MAITINIYYTGKNGSALKFAGETISLSDEQFVLLHFVASFLDSEGGNRYHRSINLSCVLRAI
jgi:hypothetical protein